MLSPLNRNGAVMAQNNGKWYTDFPFIAEIIGAIWTCFYALPKIFNKLWGGANWSHWFVTLQDHLVQQDRSDEKWRGEVTQQFDKIEKHARSTDVRIGAIEERLNAVITEQASVRLALSEKDGHDREHRGR